MLMAIARMRWAKEQGFADLLADNIGFGLDPIIGMSQSLWDDDAEGGPWPVDLSPKLNLSRVWVAIYEIVDSAPMLEQQMRDLFMIQLVETALVTLANEIHRDPKTPGKAGFSDKIRESLLYLLHTVHRVSNPASQPPRAHSSSSELAEAERKLLEQIAGTPLQIQLR
jgi:hypothetical protein